MARSKNGVLGVARPAIALFAMSGGLAVFAEFACDKHPEAKPDDFATSASASASDTNAASSQSVNALASASSNGADSGSLGTPIFTCRNGRLTNNAPSTDGSDTFGYGGLGLSGAGEGGGKGEGIGLGSVGGFGHGSGTGSGGATGGTTPIAHGGTSMTGITKVTAGTIDLEKSGRAMCDAFVKLHPCFNAIDKGKDTLAGRTSLTLVISGEGGDGRVDSIAQSGTFADESLATCLEPTLKSLVLPKPEASSATLEYTIDYARTPGPPNLRTLETGLVISGGLPAEVVKRIVRQHFAQLRVCYQKSAATNIALAGTVFVDFVISTKGVVESTKLAVGSLPDPAVGACIAKAFSSLTFPEPDKGKVDVHYGIDFEPDW